MIKCGHCNGRHETVADVRGCADYENEPVEICCAVCDGLIGYVPASEVVEDPKFCGPGGWCKVFLPI